MLYKNNKPKIKQSGRSWYVLEFIKQSLNSNNIDISDIEDLGKIFEKLGNQQEVEKVYTTMGKYLSDIKSGFSIWQYDDSNKPKMVWCEDEDRENEEIESIGVILGQYTENKKPVFDQEKTGFYSMLPIVSRERLEGYLCIHDKVEIDERWKKIYLVVAMLTYIFKYYEMITISSDLSIIDLTTGLYNLRHFGIQIDLDVTKAKRFNKPLTVAVVKIKDFDIINNKLGFEGGEEVLREFSKIFKKLSRDTDMPSRLGEETFATLMYETDEKGGEFFVNRLKNYLKGFKIEVLGVEFNLEIDHNVVQYKRTYTSEEFLNKARKL